VKYYATGTGYARESSGLGRKQHSIHGSEENTKPWIDLSGGQATRRIILENERSVAWTGSLSSRLGL
jgi:hypothetical protein